MFDTGSNPKILNNEMHSVLELCCMSPNKDEASKVAKILLDHDISLLNESIFNLAIHEHFAALVKLFRTPRSKASNFPDHLDFSGNDQYSTSNEELNYLFGIITEKLSTAPNAYIKLIGFILNKINVVTVPVLDSIIINYGKTNPGYHNILDYLITE